MASKNLETDARSTVKRVMGKLRPEQRLRVLADMLREFHMPMLALQIEEHLPGDAHE